MRISHFALLALVVIGLASCSLHGSGDTTYAQLQKELKEIDDYLASKSIVALEDINGIRFTIDSLGSGYPPRLSSSITFDYSGKLMSTGVEFEKNTLTNVKISTGLITGMQIGMPLIPNGSKATLYIPAVLAYGSQGSGKIPPNATLIFQIKLKRILYTSAEKTQLAGDTVKINNFLTAQNITTLRDTSGLRYAITQVGSGASPTWFDRVKINYTGFLIDGTNIGEKFYSGTNQPSSTNDSRVINYIRGFQLGLQKLNKGGKITLYIPSGLAFGSQALTGTVSVPANSNIIYEIELVDIYTP